MASRLAGSDVHVNKVGGQTNKSDSLAALSKSHTIRLECKPFSALLPHFSKNPFGSRTKNVWSVLGITWNDFPFAAWSTFGFVQIVFRCVRRKTIMENFSETNTQNKGTQRNILRWKHQNYAICGSNVCLRANRLHCTQRWGDLYFLLGKRFIWIWALAWSLRDEMFSWDLGEFDLTKIWLQNLSEETPKEFPRNSHIFVKQSGKLKWFWNGTEKGIDDKNDWCLLTPLDSRPLSPTVWVQMRTTVWSKCVFTSNGTIQCAAHPRHQTRGASATGRGSRVTSVSKSPGTGHSDPCCRESKRTSTCLNQHFLPPWASCTAFRSTGSVVSLA